MGTVHTLLMLTKIGIPKMTIVPEPLQPFVAGLAWTRITVGESKSAVFRLDRSGQAALYLKVAPRAHRLELLWEKKRLDWLQGRLPVPGVVWVRGGRPERVPVAHCRARPSRCRPDWRGVQPTRRSSSLLATGLRAIHALPIHDCPFDMTLDREDRKGHSQCVQCRQRPRRRSRILQTPGTRIRKTAVRPHVSRSPVA